MGAPANAPASEEDERPMADFDQDPYSEELDG